MKFTLLVTLVIAASSLALADTADDRPQRPRPRDTGCDASISTCVESPEVSRRARSASERIQRIANSIDYGTRHLLSLAQRDSAYGYQYQSSVIYSLERLQEAAEDFHEAVRNNCCASPRLHDVRFRRLSDAINEVARCIEFAGFSGRTYRSWCKNLALYDRLSVFFSRLRADEGRYPYNDRQIDNLDRLDYDDYNDGDARSDRPIRRQ
ncbi:MAG: hypothetical protein SGI74_06615 [Oligoflexia bacterium]|nr:hypothetical protein [Oligoflexia bacterium]